MNVIRDITDDKSALFREWLHAGRQQVIIRANVDSDPCRQMAPLGHNELMRVWLEFVIYFNR